MFLLPGFKANDNKAPTSPPIIKPNLNLGLIRNRKTYKSKK